MSKALQMEAGGVPFLIESDDSVAVPEGAREVRVSVPGVAPGMDAVAGVEDLGPNFAQVQEVIVACCNSLHAALSRMPHWEKVEVEFGVKLAGEVGLPMITKASGEANFKVVVEWKPAAPR